jgi:hypothetical protein
MLEWEIAPKKGLKMNAELERQIELATFCWSIRTTTTRRAPCSSRSPRTSCSAPALAKCRWAADPSALCGCYPVDGLTIQIYADWDGQTDAAGTSKSSVRQLRHAGGGTVNSVAQRRADLHPAQSPPRPRRSDLDLWRSRSTRSAASWAWGVRRQRGNQLPTRASVSILATAAMTRRPTRSDRTGATTSKGKGNMPIFAMTSTGNDGKTRGPSVLRFYPEGDDGLYLQYQEFCSGSSRPRSTSAHRTWASSAT